MFNLVVLPRVENAQSIHAFFKPEECGHMQILAQHGSLKNNGNMFKCLLIHCLTLNEAYFLVQRRSEHYDVVCQHNEHGNLMHPIISNAINKIISGKQYERSDT